MRERGDLERGGVGVGRVGVRHRLDDDRVAREPTEHARRRPTGDASDVAPAVRLVGRWPWVGCSTTPPSRAMSKYVIQTRNANRSDEPDEVGQPLGLER